MDKRLTVKMNGNRKVQGTLIGYDQFLNLVLDDASDEGTKIGMIVIRGNGIVQLQSVERI